MAGVTASGRFQPFNLTSESSRSTRRPGTLAAIGTVRRSAGFATFRPAPGCAPPRCFCLGLISHRCSQTRPLIDPIGKSVMDRCQFQCPGAQSPSFVEPRRIRRSRRPVSGGVSIGGDRVYSSGGDSTMAGMGLSPDTSAGFQVIKVAAIRSRSSAESGSGSLMTALLPPSSGTGNSHTATAAGKGSGPRQILLRRLPGCEC